MHWTKSVPVMLTRARKRKIREKKIKFIESEYSSLSPDIIIFEILPYVSIDTSDLKTFVPVKGRAQKWIWKVYGYFILDQLRNPWIVFRSIRFTIPKISTSTKWRWENIFSFPKKISSPDRSLITPKLVSPGGSLWGSFDIKTISDGSSRNFEWDQLFSQHLKTIGSLTPRRINKLTVSFYCCAYVQEQEFQEQSELISIVDSLIYYPSVAHTIPLFTPDNGQFLEHAQNLLHLKIIQRRSFEFGSITDWPFQNYTLSRLQTLTIENSRTIQGQGWNVMPQLKILKLFDCPEIDGVLFETPQKTFPRLQQLHLFSFDLWNGLKWGPFLNLVYLLITGQPIFNDALFQNPGNLPQLKVLLLHKTIALTGENWELPNIELIHYQNGIHLAQQYPSQIHPPQIIAFQQNIKQTLKTKKNIDLEIIEKVYHTNVGIVHSQTMYSAYIYYPRDRSTLLRIYDKYIHPNHTFYNDNFSVELNQDRTFVFTNYKAVPGEIPDEDDVDMMDFHFRTMDDIQEEQMERLQRRSDAEKEQKIQEDKERLEFEKFKQRLENPEPQEEEEEEQEEDIEILGPEFDFRLL